MAKQVLAEKKKMVLPPVYVDIPNRQKKHLFLYKNTQTITFDSVEIESGDFEGFRPDAVGFCGGRPLVVEFRMSHEVDKEKIERIRDVNVSAVEVDLRQVAKAISTALPVRDYLERCVLCDWQDTKWLNFEPARFITDRIANAEVVTVRFGLPTGGVSPTEIIPLCPKFYAEKEEVVSVSVYPTCHSCPYRGTEVAPRVGAGRFRCFGSLAPDIPSSGLVAGEESALKGELTCA